MRTLLLLFSSCSVFDFVATNETESNSCAEGESCSSEPTPAPAYYWASKGGNPRRTGVSEHTGPTDFFMGPTWIWENASSGSTLLRSSPLIDDKKNIYLATAPGEVLKFSPDGDILWRYQAQGDLVPDVPTLDGGALFGNTDTGHVFSVDMETGKEIFSVSVLGAALYDVAVVAVCEGLVLSKAIKPAPVLGLQAQYPFGGAPRIVALDAKNGDLRWFFVTDSTTYGVMPICVGDSTVIIADKAGGAYRLSLEDGSLLWKVGGLSTADYAAWSSTGGAVLGPDGTLYTTSNGWRSGTEDGYVKAYRVTDGKLLWAQQMGLPANVAPAVGKVAGVPGDGLSLVIPLGANPPYVASSDRSSYPLLQAGVSVLNATTGEFAKWFPAPPWQGPSAGDQELAWQRFQTLGQIHTYCGAEAWSSPSIGGDGTIYIGYMSGHFYALRSSEHEAIITITDFMGYNAGAAVRSSAAIAPGVVAVASCDKLMVFK